MVQETNFPILELATLLPQRDPFLFLDGVSEHEQGHLIATRLIRDDDYYFRGHFPGLPIVPGVLLIEMMAQACAVLYRLDDQGKISSSVIPGKIAGVDKVRFYKSVGPGEALSIETHMKHRLGQLGRYEASIHSGNDLIAEAVLTLVAPKQ